MCITKRYFANKNICKVTFTLPYSLAKNAAKAYVVGEFNNWDTSVHRMKMVSGKLCRSLKLDIDKDYQFRYLINDTLWKNDHEADAEVSIPFGEGYNSVLKL